MTQPFDTLLGTFLILLAIGFGLVDMGLYASALSQVHGLRRVVYALILFTVTYFTSVYTLSFIDWLPDGAAVLSFLLRPALVGLLGFLAVLRMMERRH